MAAEFVDEVRIRVRAGEGGRGAVSFLREKHKPRGGPDGGDGGHGGSVVLAADDELASLAAYVRGRNQQAAGGERGSGNRRRGADGADLVLPVPVGTVVRDTETSELIADLARPGARYTVARGGRGGRGNATLRSRADRVPNYAEPGEPGEEHDVVLELHLVADVGLIGLPNAGKSTLLGAISRADPKIGDYPFTTLTPGLGVVEREGERIVVADLPGLIEGASEGKGLGLRFLRHAERCGILAVVVDLTTSDPAGDVRTVVAELKRYDPGLVPRARVVVGNKIDLDRADARAVRAEVERLGARLVEISAAAGTRVDDLLLVFFDEVPKAKAERGEALSFAVFRPVTEDRLEVVREDDAFRVRSDRVERAVAQTPMDNPGALRRLQQRLKSLGVETALRKLGVSEGDEIRIGEIAFEYFPEDDDA
ncbi:MAG: GTPase ObgE [Actinomycetota bacterium]